MATLVISPESQQQFEELPGSVQGRIRKVFVRLRNWPEVSGAKPLRGGLAGQYRIRTGDYRVQFYASDRTATAVVTVVRVGHRDGFYDD